MAAAYYPDPEKLNTKKENAMPEIIPI